MAETVSVRIGKQELAEISSLSKAEKRSRSEVLREALEMGINEKRVAIAVQKYQRREATAAKAAQVAGVSLSAFLDILFARKIEFDYDGEDFRSDIKDLH